MRDDCTKKAIHPFYFSCKDPSEECPETMVYNYSVKHCNQSCRSLDEPDPLCKVHIPPMEGCACPEGTYLNDEEQCVAPDDCPCYYKGKIVQPGNSFQEDKLMWWVALMMQRLFCAWGHQGSWGKALLQSMNGIILQLGIMANFF